MNMVVGTPSANIASPSRAAAGPSHVILAQTFGETSTGATANKIIVPNALTRQVMAETEAGKNVVSCSSMKDLFEKLDA